MQGSISTESLELVRFPLVGSGTSGLTSSDLKVQVTDSSNCPSYADAGWKSIASFSGGVVGFMVGPTSPIGTLTPGRHHIHIRIDSAATGEKVVMYVGQLPVSE